MPLSKAATHKKKKPTRRELEKAEAKANREQQDAKRDAATAELPPDAAPTTAKKKPKSKGGGRKLSPAMTHKLLKDGEIQFFLRPAPPKDQSKDMYATVARQVKNNFDVKLAPRQDRATRDRRSSERIRSAAKPTPLTAPQSSGVHSLLQASAFVSQVQSSQDTASETAFSNTTKTTMMMYPMPAHAALPPVASIALPPVASFFFDSINVHRFMMEHFAVVGVGDPLVLAIPKTNASLVELYADMINGEAYAGDVAIGKGQYYLLTCTVFKNPVPVMLKNNAPTISDWQRYLGVDNVWPADS